MKIPKNKIALLVSILAVSALAVFCGILVMTSDSFTPNTKYSFTVLLLAIEAAVIAVLFTMQEQLTQRKDDAAARKEIADQEKAVAEKETELKDKSMAVAAREQNLREQQNELVELKQLVLRPPEKRTCLPSWNSSAGNAKPSKNSAAASRTPSPRDTSCLASCAPN